MIWREKEGFFTAFDKEGRIQTWSIATGKKLYSLETSYSNKMFSDYEIY